MRITITLGLLSLFFIGCADSPDAVDSTADTTTTDAETAAVNTDAAAEQQVLATDASGEYLPVTLEVPTMHCPFACYPAVKETLEEQPGVTAVELVPQKEEGVIDDRRVVVKVEDGFDASQAIAALSKAGYDKAEVQN